MGSLGDLHPMIALGIELNSRGHDVTISAMEFYREMIETTGLGFAPMAPHLEPGDEQLAKDLMDTAKGSENVIRKLIMPNLREMYDDLMRAVEGADLLATGEIVYASKSVVEKTGIKWVTTTLAPMSFFSVHDPPIPPPALWFEKLRFLGPGFHRLLFKAVKKSVKDWLKEYGEFRRELGLSDEDDPIMGDKFSDDLHLVMFSKVLGTSQPDWPKHAVQTGFCFYDGRLVSGLPDELQQFLEAGEPPIVFTLGSAAVMDARDFFDESAKAAKQLGRRAVLLYGRDNTPPKGMDENIVGFEYAPYSLVFPRAACVVHQGGVGTTAQVLYAGVPHLIMPYGHDQPDNAARCRRIGVGETIGREKYNATTAAQLLDKILSDPKYLETAKEKAEIVRSEDGTVAACNAIEGLLS